ncbi:MAG: exopolyphosphatase [Prochlorococcus sp. SP3034]|nr:exopolyphosphatase [Prochlorococcus sp. SP3034]|tara:strand:- start:1952 stop:3541 length:1590 start_codon:yes stop_codon:yes gene_type:complete
MENKSNNFNKKDIFVASIDIGTNSTHLLIAQVNAELKSFNIKFTEKSTTRLGERDEDGNLTEESINRVLETLKRFKEYCFSYGVERILAAATSAVRESPNGKSFINKIKDEVGFQVELISGAEEARLIYLGVLSGMDLENRSHIILDIGGGSTELILANSEDTRALTSARVGAVRLKNDFLDGEPLNTSRIEFLKTFIMGSLEPSVGKIKKRIKKNEPISMVATSGTAISLGNLISSGLGEPKQKMHGYKYTQDDIDSTLQKLFCLSSSERRKIQSLSERRSEIIIPGGLILKTCMEMLDINELTISERALREGLVVDWMIRKGMLKSKFGIQSNIRKTTVMHQADKFAVDKLKSEKVAKIALQIYDQTYNILHRDQNKRGRNLLWAACFLYNSGKQINLTAYHKHSWYLIKNCELLGYSLVEKNIIAAIARYHRKTLPKKRHESWQNLISREDKAIALDMSLILRLAAAINKRPDPVVSSVKIKLSDNEISFQLISSDPGTNLILEKWSLESCNEVIKELKNLVLKVV